MKRITFVKHGPNEGQENWQTFDAPPLSRIFCDGQGNFRSLQIGSLLTGFEMLPAATVAAGSEKLLVSLGTSTEVIARATKGGINVKSQASTPADDDNAMLIGISTTASYVALSKSTLLRFGTQVNLTQISELVFGAGLDENLTSPIGSATAGDGAQFLFDPANELSTGVATYATNFILATKVNGTDAYIDSGIAVNAATEYNLEIAIGADLIAKYYINGVLVGTAATALTSGDSVGVVIGVQVNANPPAGQKDFDCRYVALERSIG